MLVPLVITDAELDEALGVWEEALDVRARVADAASGESPCMVGDVLAERYELEELVGYGRDVDRLPRARPRARAARRAQDPARQRYNDEDEVERFRREARAVAQLSHPNIVTVIDRGEHEGRQYIVFEYVDGDNLKEVVERDGPLPVEPRARARDPDRPRARLRARSTGSCTAT